MGVGQNEMRYLDAMSVHAIALRVLLILALVLNGAGHAQTPLQMRADAGAPQRSQHDRLVVDAGILHCAGHQAPTTAAAAGDPADAADPDDGDHALPDCCKSSACRCACTHACSSLMPAVAQTVAVTAQELSPAAMALGYPAPALPHLIRPPIA